MHFGLLPTTTVHPVKIPFHPIAVGPPANTGGYSSTSQPITTAPVFPQPSPPTNTGYPPACPAGTSWDDGSGSCLPYGYATVDPTAGGTAACPSNTTLDPVSGMCIPATSSAGPSVSSTPIYVPPMATGMSSGMWWAIGLLGAAIIGLGAFAISRR